MFIQDRNKKMCSRHSSFGPLFFTWHIPTHTHTQISTNSKTSGMGGWVLSLGRKVWGKWSEAIRYVHSWRFWQRLATTVRRTWPDWHLLLALARIHPHQSLAINKSPGTRLKIQMMLPKCTHLSNAHFERVFYNCTFKGKNQRKKKPAFGMCNSQNYN